MAGRTTCDYKQGHVAVYSFGVSARVISDLDDYLCTKQAQSYNTRVMLVYMFP